MGSNLKQAISRRDFLKLASVGSLSFLTAPLLNRFSAQSQSSLPNIIILVFDAWSAENVSLYGYPRQTMPNLETFANRAIVYHNHYSAGRFTTPGTASLLTGLYPWTHRAFSLGSGILKQLEEKNIFALLAEKYNTLGYAQNKYADVFLKQFRRNLDAQVPSSAFNSESRDFYMPLLKNDSQIAFSSFDDSIIRDESGYDASLFLGPLLRTLHLYERRVTESKHRFGYPHGLPETDAREYFLLKNVVDGAIDTLQNIQAPTIAYFHFYPPHDPYRPSKKFKDSFKSKNAWEPGEKPTHPRSIYNYSYEDLLIHRYRYDDYLATWDDEVARLFSFICESGLSENSYVIITSDHGEMFERGELGHVTYLIYEPLIHIPLIISRPGQTTREDVHAYTSSVDILPTLTQITGLSTPDWVEGAPLPKLGGFGNDQRSIYTVDAADNSSFKPLTRSTLSLTKGHFRLTYYNYPDYQRFEFYDLDADPEELNNLYPSQPMEALQMRDEMLQKMSEVDQPFKGN
jgi:arylsulfatase A-like enzyme